MHIQTTIYMCVLKDCHNHICVCIKIRFLLNVCWVNSWIWFGVACFTFIIIQVGYWLHIFLSARSGDSRGFGFLTLERDEDADAAIRALDETEWNGRIILVEKTKSMGR